MTTLFMDGFDHYGSSFGGVANMLNGVYATFGTSSGSGPGIPSWGTRTGAFSLAGASTTTGLRYVLPSTQNVIFQSFGFSIPALPSADSETFICDFSNSSNVMQCRLMLQSTGGIALTNSSGNIIATTSGPVITAATWHFLEMQYNATSGTFTLRVDDAQANLTPAMSATGLTLQTCAQITYMSIAQAATQFAQMWIDDLFIRNGSGSVNNSWLGDRQVATLYPNSDSTPQGWTPSFYKEFGQGILRLGFKVPNDNSVQNSTAGVAAAAATALDIGSADFTIESMVRFDALPSIGNYTTLFNRWDAGGNQRSFRLIFGSAGFNNSCLQFDTTTDGHTGTLQTPILFPWFPAINTWYHVAIVRASGQLLLFVNGQQLGLPINDSRTYFSGGTESMSVGAEMTGTNVFTVVNNTTMSGRMDETRFTNGVARYTGPFSPPVAAFPRGSGGDANWSQVVWLMGYDNGVLDESSFNRTVSPVGGAISFIPTDGSAIGNYSTLNKQTPDDNTFISASLINATNTLTMTTQPANGNTVTVGTTNGTTAAVYTFKTAITTAFDVLIDTTAQGSLINLLNAINAGAGSGTKYGTGTTVNFDVTGSQLPVGQILVTANTAGTAGNSVASTATGSAASWAHTTLTGGLNIPSPSDFKFQRPPNNTTVISAVQTIVRANKTDSGTANIQTALIGPLGGTLTGAAHALSITPSYLTDIIESDPDTSGPISPTTLINGKFQINRTV